LLSWQLTIISVMLFAVGRNINAARKVQGLVLNDKAGGWYASVSLEFINGIRTVQVRSSGL